MKKLLLAMLAVVLFSTIDANAGIVTKKHVAAATVTNSASPSRKATSSLFSRGHNTRVEKQTFRQRLAHAFLPSSDNIPKPLYVVLAIFWLGWLGMGINDNFEGWNWVISLLLYCLFWLPGVIYTLIMMRDYY